MNEFFRKFAHKISLFTGSPWTFVTSLSMILIWILVGPVFDYSDTWQLAINTSTTVITFLMVFLIQNTQNRDSKAVHLKLDEVIRSIKSARNSLVDLEELSDDELAKLEDSFKKIRQRYSNTES